VAKALFTAEQVYEVADGIAAEGKDVTAKLLHARLGGASLTTIYNHLVAWRQGRQQNAAPMNSQSIPEPVQAAFSTALGRAWSAVTTEAAKEIAAVKEKATAEVRTANTELEGAIEAIERLEEQAEAETAKIESLTARLTEVEAALKKSENEKAAEKATTEQLRHQVKSQQAELDRVHKDSESERSRHQQEIERGRTAQEAANKQIDELKQNVAETQRLRERAEHERDDARAQKEKADQRSQQVEQEALIARKDREAAVTEVAQTRGQLDALKEQNSELLAKLTERKQASKN
jgi:chromosome segregation ATPase